LWKGKILAQNLGGMKMVNCVTHNKSKAVHSNQSYRKGPTRGKARGRRDYTMLLKKLRKEAA
jgi:hypothetical protein